MPDPLEGRTADGMITTGVGRDRVPGAYRPVVDAAIEAVAESGTSLYLYGSVATGQARPPTSDVDLLAIGLSSEEASTLSWRLSERFAGVCRGVEIAPGMPHDFTGDSDEAYGGRVFLHHYCVHLAGEDHDDASSPFPADRRAARGFNGDIGRALDRWRASLASAARPAVRTISRKTLFAVTGLVSIHDETWTTDRLGAATRWADIEPRLANDLTDLVAWSEGGTADDAATEHVVEEVVPVVVAAFADEIGLWGESPPA